MFPSIKTKILTLQTGLVLFVSVILGMSSFFLMVDSLKKIERKNHIQIAVLNKDREDEGRKDFVNIAQFMGMVHMRHFKIYDDAITWLLGGKDIFK